MSEDVRKTEDSGRRSADRELARTMVDIEKLDLRMTALTTEITILRIEVGKLSVKAGMWGAMAGAATAAIPIVALLIALMRWLK